MSKIITPSSGPDDWQQFLAEPQKQWCPSSEFFGELRRFRNGGSGSVSVRVLALEAATADDRVLREYEILLDE